MIRCAIRYHERPTNETTRPPSVTAAVLLVLLQLLIAVTAKFTAALAPADYKTYAVTTPVFLIVGYGVVAYFLWAGRPWARILAMAVAALRTDAATARRISPGL